MMHTSNHFPIKNRCADKLIMICERNGFDEKPEIIGEKTGQRRLPQYCLTLLLLTHDAMSNQPVGVSRR